MFKTYFVLPFHQIKARVCLSPVWLQHQVRHNCPAQLRTELHEEVLTQDITPPRFAKRREHQYYKPKSALEMQG